MLGSLLLANWAKKYRRLELTAVLLVVCLRPPVLWPMYFSKV